MTIGATSGSSIRSDTLTISAGRSAVRAPPQQVQLTRTVRHDLIGVVAERPAVTLVTGLGAAGLGLLALLLAIRGGRLGGGARGLLRSLQPQHQLDQLLLAQTLKIAAAHLTRESANSAPRKGVGNYF